MPVLLRSLLRLGPINPIAVRLVHNGSRRAKHLYLRLGYLGVLIAVLLWALVINVKADEMSFRELASAGALSFQAIAYLQIGLICVLAPVFMAGAIAQEADPQTWDILLTTPLGAAEIVLGNLIGRLFFILALLLASLPLFAVTQYFGGVSGETILASYAIAACAAVVVGCAAVALSVSRVVGKRAVFTFYISVVSFIVLTLGCDGVIGGGTTVTYFTALNPFLSVRALLDSTGYASMPVEQAAGWDRWFLVAPVQTFCALSGIVSVLLIGASIITVRIGGIAGVGGLGGSSGRGSNADGSARAPWYRRLLGFAAAGAQTRAARHVWTNPISWREAASRNATFGRTASRWGFLIAGVGFGAALVVLLHLGRLSPGTFRTVMLFTVVGELAVITLVAINMAATSVSREREDGTLDLLLTTPITPSQYLTGKLRGMVYYLLPMLAVPLLTLGLAGVYSFIGEIGGLGDPNPIGVTYTMSASSQGWGGGAAAAVTSVAPLVLAEAFIVATLVTLPFMALCVMVGMYMSLRSKGTLGAVVWSVGVMSVVAGFVGLCAWNAASSINVLGSVLAALSPASTAYALIYPELAMFGTAGNTVSGMSAARTGLFIGALLSATAHIAVVYGMRSAMTRNFDMTVRKLAGMK
jgi:ABC-type transport system involved in multi-copper enzyme maturation permease subunit